MLKKLVVTKLKWHVIHYESPASNNYDYYVWLLSTTVTDCLGMRPRSRHLLYQLTRVATCPLSSLLPDLCSKLFVSHRYWPTIQQVEGVLVILSFVGTRYLPFCNLYQTLLQRTAVKFTTRSVWSAGRRAPGEPTATPKAVSAGIWPALSTRAILALRTTQASSRPGDSLFEIKEKIKHLTRFVRNLHLSD